MRILSQSKKVEASRIIIKLRFSTKLGIMPIVKMQKNPVNVPPTKESLFFK
tara:strand:+ start:2175 stop:2327 length:153 start_codon:yes stop_codon:yes gene_type:complete